MARRVLLDALEALGTQRDAAVLVGAHAIYLRIGEVDLAVAPFTTDGDVVLDPRNLAPEPKLGDAMAAAGFVRDLTQPGVWVGSGSVKIDLLVPEALGGRGRRGARLGSHGNRAARKARGLEAALVDKGQMTIAALEQSDSRRFEMVVAGPAALLVAKLHKLADRGENPDRLADKDALDVLRLLRGISTQELADRLERLVGVDLSAYVTREALGFLYDLFARPEATGSAMAARAAGPLEDPDTVAASCAVLSGELLAATEAVRGT